MVDNVVSKLFTLCQNRCKSGDDFNAFQSFVEDMDQEELENIVTTKILSADAPQIVSSLFLGLSQKGSSQKKRVKLFELLISAIQEKELLSSSVSQITTWLVIELDKLSNTHLIKICDLCVSLVNTSKTASHTCWKDLLPNILTIIVSKKEVDHFGSEMTGEEYKKLVITALCQAKWNPEILTPLAAMFTSIPLATEEHLLVLNKLCSRLNDLDPNELPPFTHQVLLLTKQQNAMTFFFALKKYYNDNIYHTDDSSAMLDSTRMDSVDAIECASIKEVENNEGMVLYHIEDSARRSLGCITEFVKCAKASVPAPELFLDPFLLAVLLTISTVPAYETQVLETLKSMIIKVVEEEEKQKESDWLRKILTTNCNVEQILTKLIRSRVCEQEGVVRGLLALSKSLLDASVGVNKGREKAVSRVWHYGRMISVNVIRKQSRATKFVLNSLIDAILMHNGHDVPQYTDCLGEICETSPLLVIEQVGVVPRLYDALSNLPGCTTHRVTAALVTLSKYSTRLRDALILVLRKSLFNRDISTRKMAVIGFLQLLKKLKIRGMHSLSQNSFQLYTCPSIFTQTCMDFHTQQNANPMINNNNEAICLEVMGVLKRCFTQQLAVKICLYNGLNQALLQNQELCGPVGGFLVDRLEEYLQGDDIVPPLNFTKAVFLQSSDVIVQEPLGLLVFVVSQVTTTGQNFVNDGDYDAVISQKKLTTMMKSLVGRFGECELKHLQLDGDSGATNPEESKYQEEVLRQCLSVQEALIGYLLLSWDLTVDIEHPQSLLRLFRAYNKLLDFAKNQAEAKTNEGTKRKAGNKEAAGKKNRGFTAPETVLNFETVHRFLSILLENSVSWATEEMAAEIKMMKPLHRFALQCCSDVISNAKNQLKEYKSKTTFGNATDTAALLYNRILSRFTEYTDFNNVAAIMGLECFTEICSLILTHFKRQFSQFLEGVCEVEESLGINQQLECVIKLYLRTFGKALDAEEDNEEDPHIKRLINTLITGINLFTLQLPSDGSCISKVLKWLMDLSQQRSLSSIPSTKIIMTLMLRILSRCKSETSVHDNLALQFCSLFGTINEAEVDPCTVKLEMVTDANKEAIFPLLCSALKSRLEAVDWVILRLRAELALINLQGSTLSSPSSKKGVLKKKERDMVQELGLIVSATQYVATVAVPLGPLPEIVARLLLHTYATLTAFTKYFSLRSSNHNPCYQEARFSKLVKLSASQLSSQVADFLLYIEAVDGVEDGEKKKTSAVTLRQAKKQIVYVPKLVAQLENYTKCITQLSMKCKDPSLTANMKLTTTRDFRLNANKLEEVIKTAAESNSDEDNEDEDEANTSKVSASGSKSSQNNPSQNVSQKVNTSKRGTQPRKRQKK